MDGSTFTVTDYISFSCSLCSSFSFYTSIQDNLGVESELPTGLTFDGASKQFTFDTGVFSIGDSYEVKVIVNDDLSAIGETEVFTIRYAPVNQIPQLTSISGDE